MVLDWTAVDSPSIKILNFFQLRNLNTPLRCCCLLRVKMAGFAPHGDASWIRHFYSLV
uniref:Uncharacterized protein n=1 Tax=Ralstonia solanacearum CFBP2957 TaxID=859656 RepID=D8P2Y0_RALSL|nr:protein of unknown function [Ralstonia solanacearum CFBP2957]